MTSVRRASLVAAAAACLLAAAASAQKAPPDYPALLRTIDSQLVFDEGDLSAEVTVTAAKLGGGTSTNVAAVFRRDWVDQLLIVLLEPAADRGKGYLKKGDNLWLYDPADRSFAFTSAKEKFQNSTARNSDFARSSLERDYTVTGESAAKLGKFDCRVLDLAARSDSVSFQRKRIWISADNLPRMEEDYSVSGTLLRTVAMPTYLKVGAKFVPARTIIVDNLKSKKVGGKTVYEQTTIDIAKASVVKLPDSTYSKEYLERIGK